MMRYSATPGSRRSAVSNGNGATRHPLLRTLKHTSISEGIAFDNDGKLLVVEVDTKRLLRIDLKLNSVFIVADGLEIGLEAVGGAPATWMSMSSVAVSKSGDLYVTGDVGNVIYRIKKT